MAMKIEIELSEQSSVTGRNGTRKIKTLQVVHFKANSDRVYLDFISRARGLMLNAGAIIGENDMDKLAEAWIKYRKTEKEVV